MTDDYSSLGLAELYEELIPPQTPPDISMMPQTIGWVWLGLAVAALALYALKFFVAQRRRTFYRREALAALQKADNSPAEIATILKQTALAAYPRERVAGLTGRDWLAFLDSTVKAPIFTDTAAGKSLISAPYQQTNSSKELAALAQKWVILHKPMEAAK